MNGLPMKVNLGSGTHPAPGWTNLDSDASHPGVDLVADVTALPFDDGAVAVLYAGHILEHIPLDSVATTLSEWRRVLAADGVLMIVGPDIDRAVRQREPDYLLDAIIAHGAPPAGHAWTCSEGVLRHFLVGWTVESVPISSVRLPEWPNVAPEATWQLALRCT